MKHGQNRFIFGFLVIPLLLYFVFVILPFGSSMIIAFTRWRGVSTNITFTGLANLQKLIGDELFWKALLHNFEVLVPLVLITLTMSLFFAALFARGLRGQRFFRVTFFFPQVLSAAVVAVLFGYVYHPTIGILSSLLGTLGLRNYPPSPGLAILPPYSRRSSLSPSGRRSVSIWSSSSPACRASRTSITRWQSWTGPMNG